jgi:flagellar biosynthesis/type III secretory pathway protein FliH
MCDNNLRMEESQPLQPQAIERRTGPDQTLLALLSKNQEIHQQTLEKLLSEMSDKLNEHIDNEQAAVTAAVAAGVKMALAEAFPGGDAAGHRKGHEDEIQNANERKKTRLVLTIEILKGLATAFVLWAGYALWGAFLKGPSP